MSTIINKYRIYCITEDTYRYTWGITPPTTCPVNGAHTVNPDSINDIKIRLNKSLTFSDTPYYAHNEYLDCDTTAGVIDVRLPDASRSQYGDVYIIRSAGSNNVFVYNGTSLTSFHTISTSGIVNRYTSDGSSWTQADDKFDDYEPENHNLLSDVPSYRTIPKLFNKGSILTSDTQNETSLLAGADGTVLFSDSTQILGLKWDTIKIDNIFDIDIGTHCGTSMMGTPPFDGDILQYNSGTSMWENRAGKYETMLLTLVDRSNSSSKVPSWRKVIDNGSGSQGVYAFHFRGNVEMELYFTVQLPNSYENGSDIVPHVHFVPRSNASGTVRWGLEYSWANENSVFGNTTLITVDQAITVNTLNQHYITSFTAISGTGKTVASQLLGRLYRDATNAADTYANDAALLHFDFVFERCGVGSNNFYAK